MYYFSYVRYRETKFAGRPSVREGGRGVLGFIKIHWEDAHPRGKKGRQTSRRPHHGYHTSIGARYPLHKEGVSLPFHHFDSWVDSIYTVYPKKGSQCVITDTTVISNDASTVLKRRDIVSLETIFFKENPAVCPKASSSLFIQPAHNRHLGKRMTNPSSFPKKVPDFLSI